MVPEKPYEINDRVIPRKFSSWRGENLEQKKAVEFIVSTDAKYPILQIPTGYGKSLIAVASALLMNKSTFILVPDTHLARQYARNFNVPVIFGRKNYPCIYDESKTAAECPFEQNVKKCPVIKETMEYYGARNLDELECEEIPCPYMKARCIASRTFDVPVVMTYDYFYYAVVKAGVIPMPKLIIVDEAHLFPEKFRSWRTSGFRIKWIEEMDLLAHSTSLQSIMTLEKKGSKLRKLISRLNRKKFKLQVEKLSSLPDDILSPAEVYPFFDWVSDLEKIVNDIILHLTVYYKIPDDYVSYIYSALYFSGVESALQYFPVSAKEKVYPLLKISKMCHDILGMKTLIDLEMDSFYPDGGKYYYLLHKRWDKIEVVPLNPGHELELIEKGGLIEKIVFMSATVIPRFLVEELKLYSSYDVFYVDPITPDESRKIFFYPYAKLYRDSLDQQIFAREYVVNVIDRVLKTFSDYRGVILVAANKDIETVQRYSKYKSRLIPFRGSQKEKMRALDELEKSRNGVLVSTAWEGVDLKDDLSRFQILYQVPYMSLGDPYVLIRKKIDPKWYVLSALNKIVQGSGRSVRHAKDYSVTYIFDERVERLLSRYKDFMPKWFIRSIEKTNSLDMALAKGKRTIELLSQR